MTNIKIWFISDTHGNHDQMEVPKDIDLVIHTGDSTNYWDEYRNKYEYDKFLEWYFNLNIPLKLYIPGNHDSYIYKYEKICKKEFERLGIKILINEYTELAGLKIYGSPMTPTFGNWHYMCDRAKINKYWVNIPENIDILATHGPPKKILDLSHNRDAMLEYCGDQALFNNVLRIKPKIHCFGHIHNSEGCVNQGERVYEGINFINSSCVTDNKWGKITSNGIIKELII